MRMLAHGEVSSSPGVWDLATLVLAAAVLAGYLVASRPIRRVRRAQPVLPRWRLYGFGAGLAAAVVALSSPVEHLAEELFAGHMVQHLLLAFVAAPLLVLGRPVVVAGVALGHRGAVVTGPLRRLGHRLRSGPAGPLVLGAVHVVPWYVWHAPAAYDLALRSELVHGLEHVTLLCSGAALTWLATSRAPTGPALAAIVVGMMTMGLVAAALTFARTSFFTGHAAMSWGLTPLEDQQLGGALMWFPGSLAYLAAAGALVALRLTRPPGGISRGGRRTTTSRVPSPS
jgi:putative membrane protein